MTTTLGAGAAHWLDVLELREAAAPGSTGYAFLGDERAEARALTYGELGRRARAVGAALQEHARPGDRVLLLHSPGPDFVAGLFACVCSGLVAVPADPDGLPRRGGNGSARAAARLTAVAAHAEPAVVLTSSDRDLPEGLLSPGCRRLNGDAVATEWSSAWRAPELSPESLALLQYTSGSTGTPRGVMLSHANLLHNSAAIAEAAGYSERSVGVSWLPPYHDMGLVGGVLQPLYAGFPAHLMPPAAFLHRPARWLEAITRLGATTTAAPAFAYALCASRVTDEEIEALDLSFLETAFVGAEPIPAGTLERFAAAFAPCGFRPSAFCPSYGLAESTLMVTAGGGAAPRVVAPPRERVAPASDTRPARGVVGCGVSGPGMEVVVVDPESRAERADGVEGEIWVAGPSVALGYWSEPAESEQLFRARIAGELSGRFLRTGDLGFLRDGELFVTGRIKDLIIVRGRNHAPHDIEATVRGSHAALHDCLGAAFTIEGEDGELPVVVQELRREARREDLAAVLDAVRDAVLREHGLRLHAVLIVDPGQVPRTTSGKVRRSACRESFLAARLRPRAAWRDGDDPFSSPPPVGCEGRDPRLLEIERWLVAELARAVGTIPDEIDRSEPFVRYGLDSAVAVTMTETLGERFGIDLPVMVLWDFPTIEELAAHLHERTAESVAPLGPSLRSSLLVPLRVTGSRPPLFFVHGLLGRAWVSAPFVRGLGEDQPILAIRARGLEDGERPNTTVRQMAADYLDAIRTSYPSGPFALGGTCAGTMIAQEMACMLQDAGEAPSLVLLVDPPIARSWWQRWRGWARSLLGRTGPQRTLKKREGAAPNVLVKASIRRAVKLHRARRYHGPVAVIGSRERLRIPAWDGDGSWRRACAGDVRLFEVADDHQSVFRPDNDRMMEAVRNCIETLHPGRSEGDVAPDRV